MYHSVLLGRFEMRPDRVWVTSGRSFFTFSGGDWWGWLCTGSTAEYVPAVRRDSSSVSPKTRSSIAVSTMEAAVSKVVEVEVEG